MKLYDFTILIIDLRHVSSVDRFSEPIYALHVSGSVYSVVGAIKQDMLDGNDWIIRIDSAD